MTLFITHHLQEKEVERFSSHLWFQHFLFTHPLKSTGLTQTRTAPSILIEFRFSYLVKKITILLDHHIHHVIGQELLLLLQLGLAVAL